jgi:glycosyltransferase involved in cell wall biosynthesis
VNDGSTDDSADYLDQLTDPRIRVVHQANQGLAGALNVGLELCETEFLARLDSDDVALPTRMEKQLAFLKSHPRVGMVGTQFAWVYQNRYRRGGPAPCDHPTIDSRLMQGIYAIVHSAIMCRTAAMREIGGYWPEGISEDWDMFLRMSERYEMANLDEVLLLVRVVDGGLQSAQMAEVRARVAYSCELARRRRQKLNSLTYEEFRAQQRGERWWKRMIESWEIHARTEYRKAQTEILGGHPARGYARLAWAAACSPMLTWQRIWREWHAHAPHPSLFAGNHSPAAVKARHD